MRQTQDLAQLYQTDYLRWLDETVERLRSGQFEGLDWPNLIEELEAMGRNERNALKSNQRVLLTHLLKWCYQPERRTEGWSRTINEHRDRLLDAIEQSASLKAEYEQAWAKSYERARRNAARETGLPLETFPQQCPFDPWRILDPDWWPSDG